MICAFVVLIWHNRFSHDLAHIMLLKDILFYKPFYHGVDCNIDMFYFQTTECLCLLGCDVDAVSDTKHTPLQIMLIKDRMECVYELFCYGADCNIGDSNGDTPLHWAVQVQYGCYFI